MEANRRDTRPSPVSCGPGDRREPKTERIRLLAGRWGAARRRADACPGDEKDEGGAERGYGRKVDLARSIVRHCSMSVCAGIPAKDCEFFGIDCSLVRKSSIDGEKNNSLLFPMFPLAIISSERPNACERWFFFLSGLGWIKACEPFVLLPFVLVC
jgi:hypothetical protein